MALRANANSEYLQKTTGTFPSTAGFTVCMWVQLLTDRNASGCAWGMREAGNFAGYIVFYNPSGDGTTFLWETNNTVDIQLGSFSMTLEQWYFIALTRSGTGTNGTITYRRTPGGAFTTATGTFSLTVTIDHETVLTNPYNLTSGWFSGRIAALKQFSAVLTADELMNESEQILPVRTANLFAFRPFTDGVLADNVNDYSGNGHHMALTGALTVEDGPPIPWKMARRRMIYIPAAVGGGGSSILRQMMAHHGG